MTSFEIIYKLPKFKVTTHTNGKGLWTITCRKINHSRAEISFYDDVFSEDNVINDFESGKLKCLNHAELKVYFPKKSWDTSKHGLIYTDPNWIKEFRSSLRQLGYSIKASKDADYSEQGLQGDNYVSLDIGRSFLKESSAMISYKNNKRR
jgi:hypothetical protein